MQTEITKKKRDWKSRTAANKMCATILHLWIFFGETVYTFLPASKLHHISCSFTQASSPCLAAVSSFLTLHFPSSGCLPCQALWHSSPSLNLTPTDLASSRWLVQIKTIFRPLLHPLSLCRLLFDQSGILQGWVWGTPPPQSAKLHVSFLSLSVNNLSPLLSCKQEFFLKGGPLLAQQN